MSLLAWLATSRVGQVLAAITAALAALATALLAARRGGMREAERRAMGRDLEQREVRDAIDRDIARQPDPVERLRDRWSR